MSQHLSQRLVSLYSSSELINELERMPTIKLKFGFSGSEFSFAQSVWRLVAADRKRAGSSRILPVPEKI